MYSKNFIKCVLLTILLLLCAVPTFSQKWEWQNPKPTGNDLESTYFFHADTGFAVGRYGTLLYTTDRGNSWTDIYVNTQATLYDIVFVNRKFGWISASGGLVLATKDGGQTWETYNTGVSSPGFSISFVDTLNGWVIGWHELMHTSDGGATWEEQDSKIYSDLNAIFFINKNVGWIAGNLGKISHTNDGGKHWTTQNSNSSHWFNDISFVDENNGWAVAAGSYSGTVVHTQNGGQSWIVQNTGITNKQYWGVHAVDQNHCWVVGGSGTILYTEDGGNTWNIQENDFSNKSMTFKGVYFSDLQNGFVVGSKAAIISTSNSGTKWSTKNKSVTSETSRDIHFDTSNDGFIVGDNGTILHTNNGGEEWEVNSGETTEHLYCVFFADSQNAWIGGDNGLILHTNDGGLTWHQQTSNAYSKIQDIFFLDNSKGFAISGSGGNGYFLKTEDSGKNWTRKSVKVTNALWFVNEVEGWIVGESYPNKEKLFHTLDGGITWNEQLIAAEREIEDIVFVNENEGWIAAGDIWHTSDKGLSWSKQMNYANIHNISFWDQKNGWATGNNKLYRTNNGGNYWQQAPRNASFSYPKIFAYSSDKAWMTGFNGAILKLKGGVVDVPRFVAVQDTVDFGKMLMEQKKESTFLLKNQGTGTLEVFSISCDGENFYTPPVPISIYPYQEHELVVTFNANMVGNFEGNITIKTNDPDHKEYKLKVLAQVIQNSVIFVKSDTTGNNDGSSWTNAYNKIQDGINAAAILDLEVWVEQGTYKENIVLANNVQIFGGFNGTETYKIERRYLKNVTTIDGGKNGPTVLAASGINRTAVLDGFVIINGSQSGVKIDRGGPTIRNNIIKDNSASWGGGIYMIGGMFEADPLILNNLIYNNRATWGDGIYANNSWATVRNNTIVANGDMNGTGIEAIGYWNPSPTIINCIIWNNGDDLAETAYATFSSVQDGDTGTGNLSDDPSFVNALEYNYFLNQNSPCIDNGSPNTPNDPDGTRSDIGAFYYDRQASLAIIGGIVTDISNNKPLTEGRIILSGIKQDTTILDSEGRYVFAVPEGDNYFIKAIVLNHAPKLTGTLSASIGSRTEVDLQLDPIVDSKRLYPPRNLGIDSEKEYLTLKWMTPIQELGYDDGHYESSLGFTATGGILVTGPFEINHPLEITKIRTAFNGENANDQFMVIVYYDSLGNDTKPSNLQSKYYFGPHTIDFNGTYQEIALEPNILYLKQGQFFVGVKQLADRPMYLLFDNDGPSSKSFYGDETSAEYESISEAHMWGTFAIRVEVVETNTQAFSISSQMVLNRNGQEQLYFSEKTKFNQPLKLIQKGFIAEKQKFLSKQGLFHSNATEHENMLDLVGYGVYASESSPVVLSSENLISYLKSDRTSCQIDSLTPQKDYNFIISAIYNQGESEPSNEATGMITEVYEHDRFAIPLSFQLNQNFPNPFNPETTIRYQLLKASEVKLEIYNLLGQRVTMLVEEKQPTGKYSVKWNGKDDSGRNVASGIYLFQLKTEEFIKTRKLTLIR